MTTLLVELAQGLLDHETSSLFAVELDTLLVGTGHPFGGNWHKDYWIMKLALSLCSGTAPKTKTLNKNIPETTTFVYVFLKVTPPPQVGTYFGGMAPPTLLGRYPTLN
jgi:hypothetical protein